MWGIFCRILSVPQNIIMVLNNVMMWSSFYFILNRRPNPANAKVSGELWRCVQDWQIECNLMHLSKGSSINIRATSHTRLRACDHEIVRAQKKCPKARARHFQNQNCNHMSSSVVWSHMWLDPQLDAIPMRFFFIHVGSLHMIKYI